MLFYHFTCPWLFWGEDWKSRYDPEAEILAVPLHDILPSNRQYEREGCPERWREPVVWLTTSDETKPAEAPNIMRLRLTVRLPSGDRRLRAFAKWFGRLPAVMPDGAHRKACAHWWIYRGTIPAAQIVAAETLMGELPWWEGLD
jgi:hypothetical protein